MVGMKEIAGMANMVRWFDPSVLVTVLKPVIISSIFGKYADRRLIHAALDRTNDEEACELAEISSSLSKDEEGGIWFDYTADTGDGFDSTYSIAFSIAQSELQVENHLTKRGDLLILGGDQVYPDASIETYLERFRKPFAWAFPNDTELDEEKHPLIYAVPGNHDWYDGLTLFLALFCKKTRWKIGNWRVPQRRSYFAIRVTEKWWLWGVDFALSESVDQPQADYFESMARTMPEDANIIVCTATPGWLYGQTQCGKADTLHPTFENLDYCHKIIKNAGKKYPIPLVLSGDTHHYSRYVGEVSGTHFVTAGGGGAFLHPTHQLKEKTKAWWSRANETINIAQLKNKSTGNDDATAEDASSGQPACYPSQETSRRLLCGNFLFAIKNWKFSGILGAIYAIVGLMMVMWNDLSSIADMTRNPIFLFLVPLLILIYQNYADDANWVYHGRTIFPKSSGKKRKWILGLAHAFFHIAAITVLARTTYLTIGNKLDFAFWTWSFNVSFIALMGAVASVVAGTIFGSYLFFTSRFLGAHSNDAFSSLSLDTYKNFIRIRIQEEKLTLFPIGINKVPQRDGWMPNANTDESHSAVVPKEPLKYQMIEEPIQLTWKKFN